MQDSDYRIRTATEDDLRPALQMKAEAWRQAYGGLRDEAFFAEHEARIEHHVQWWQRGIEAGASFVVAEQADGRIIGLSGGTPVIDEDKDTGVGIELGMLYIRSEFYGSGLGAHLMETVLGRRDALVWVLEENRRARTFYEKHGFVADGTAEDLPGAWEGLREMRMVRRG